jgi:hypothetical protein
MFGAEAYAAGEVEADAGICVARFRGNDGGDTAGAAVWAG